MKQTFQKLQNQHPHVRTRIALSVATVVTVAIGLVLLTTLPLRFQDSAISTNDDNTASVASAVGDATAQPLQNLQDSWQNISGFQVRQGGASTDAPTTQVPAQDQSQDAGFPADAVKTNSGTY